MENLLVLFGDNLLPVLLTAGAGFLLSRWARPDPRPIAKVAFYLFSPALVFTLVNESQLNGGDILRMMGFAILVMLITGGAAWLIGRAIHLERRMLAAVVLASMFMNAGNFGLSVNLFAFGEDALAHASLFFVTSAMLTYTVGVVVASLGSTTLLQSLKNLVKVPAIYALALGFLFLYLDWKLPLPLDRSIKLLSNAAIPTMLVLLGLQFPSVRWQGTLRPLALSNTMRLVIAPVLAISVSSLFGLEGAARQAGILEAGMPTAVLATVVATEYDVEPAFVTAVVFASTLISAFTLTPLIAYLGG